MSDKHFVAATGPATDLVEAVHAGDVDTVRDILTAQGEASMWALTVALAAMAPAAPNPERVLRFACDVDTRLTYSTEPEKWSQEDLETALCVAKAGGQDARAMWVRRGQEEWRRRRSEREQHLKAVDAAALAARHQDEQLRAVS